MYYQPDDLSHSLGRAYKLLSGLAKLTSLVVSLLHGLYGLLRLTMLKEAYMIGHIFGMEAKMPEGIIM